MSNSKGAVNFVFTAFFCLFTSYAFIKDRGAYKETVEAVFLDNADPEEYISRKGLMMVSDVGAIVEAVTAVLSKNPEVVADYCAGNDKAFEFLMGQIMKCLKGIENPIMIKKTLMDMLM